MGQQVLDSLEITQQLYQVRQNRVALPKAVPLSFLKLHCKAIADISVWLSVALHCQKLHMACILLSVDSPMSFCHCKKKTACGTFVG